MTYISKHEARIYASITKDRIRKKRRIKMFKEARKFHKPPIIKHKLAMKIFKFWDQGKFGFDFESLGWSTEMDADHLLKKCELEMNHTVQLNDDEVEMISYTKQHLEKFGY